MDQLAKLLIAGGLLLAAAGVVVFVLSHSGIPLGRLPGDITVERPGFRFYFPLATSLLVSVIASILFWLFFRR